jgi:CheY-like chemotaxis protein
MAEFDQTNVSPTPNPKPLGRPKRLLIIEDESLVALVMADQVAELGYIAVGPACTMREARHLASSSMIDGALVDLNLHGVLSHEIADIQSRRQIPFVFITGCNELPDGLDKSIGVLQKPFQLSDLGRAIEGVLCRRV